MRTNVQRSSTARTAAATMYVITRSGPSTVRAGTDLNWTPSILTDLPAKVRQKKLQSYRPYPMVEGV